MTQIIIVGIVFLIALGYIARLIYRSFQAESCASGCGKCSAVDFNEIGKAIREKEMLSH
jgi:hypothetical protein